MIGIQKYTDTKFLLKVLNLHRHEAPNGPPGRVVPSDPGLGFAIPSGRGLLCGPGGIRDVGFFVCRQSA